MECGGGFLNVFFALNERTQVVSMRGTSLCTKRVPHGLPQWPIWAQYSFTLQSTTSMNSSIICCLWMKRLCLAEGVLLRWQRKWQHTLESSGRWWLDSNKVMLNWDKTQMLRCSTQSRNLPSNDSSVKLLWFVLDPKLTCDDHATTFPSFYPGCCFY